MRNSIFRNAGKLGAVVEDDEKMLVVHGLAAFAILVARRQVANLEIADELQNRQHERTEVAYDRLCRPHAVAGTT